MDLSEAMRLYKEAMVIPEEEVTRADKVILTAIQDGCKEIAVFLEHAGTTWKRGITVQDRGELVADYYAMLGYRVDIQGSKVMIGGWADPPPELHPNVRYLICREVARALDAFHNAGPAPQPDYIAELGFETPTFEPVVKQEPKKESGKVLMFPTDPPPKAA